jgi:23S rRNA (guanine745-N1)-methyltransferase
MQFKNSADLLNLLAMTPFAFKASSKLIDSLKKINTFTCQADFILRLYQKKKA